MTIKIESVSFEYDKKSIFSDISVEIPLDTITGIWGRNGSGKTTFLQMLLGISPVTSGHIVHPFTRPLCTFQTPVILNTSVYKNVEHTAKAFDRACRASGDCPPIKYYEKRKHMQSISNRIDNALEQVDLLTIQENFAQTLSGGQKMRLQIARLLACKADMWLLDEPFSGLDSKSVDILLHCIKDAGQKGIKVFVVSHNIDYVKALCYDVLTFKSQNNIQYDTITDFLERKNEI